jgi:DNA-binding NtrC family response regulator
MAKKIKVLIVDDEPALLNVVGRMAERLGYNAITTLNGKDALRIVEEDDVDVILLDVVLRDITIVELVNRINAVRPNRKIILMSGHFQHLEINISGRMPFLQKPFTIQELRDALAQAQGRAPAGAV